MISVIICTHSPRIDLLVWTLESLSVQNLPRDQWELVIVDNRSAPPVHLEAVLPKTAGLTAKLVREEEPGLSAARCAGIAASRGELLVLVDDDNRLDSQYLSHAARIAAERPELGAFGGRAFPFYESPPPPWVGNLVNNLGLRDYGDQEIVSRESGWGPWEPIGAGMVVRRQVAEAFVQFYRENQGARRLGRKGNSLASCEDSLIAHLSLRLGYANAYMPQLSLTHFIKDFRTRPSYFARLLQALGSSYLALLELKSGQPTPHSDPRSTMEELAKALRYRLQTLGDAGYLQWQWDVGHALPRLAVAWPRVSVVIPTFNCGSTLRRTFESLRAQVYPNLQVVVQDGGSTDDTLALCREYADIVTVLESCRDSGQANAINRGFAKADGEIRAWLCGDDEYRPGALFYIALQALLHPECDFFVAGTLRVFPDGNTASVSPQAAQVPTLGFHNFIDQPSTFWRARLQERAGPLDEQLHYAFDWEYWNRLFRAGAQAHFSEVPLSVYYFSDSNKTSTAGSRQVPELAAIVSRYGPLNGRLAKIYRLLYQRFDLAGCYDSPPSAPPEKLRRFERVLSGLVQRYGQEVIYSYNWSYASRQERGIPWYK
jgi:glycosyltransferase involved in cell wall biosynthesis